MKIKFSPIHYIFAFYICLNAYFLFAYFGFQRSLANVQLVNLSPVATGLLIVCSVFLALSVFSLFRVPIFHYLFKMLNLWIIILCCLILYLYFKYGHSLNDIIGAKLLHKLAEIFPDSPPDIFQPLVNMLQGGLKALNAFVVIVFMIMTITLAVIQTILYMPSSLRFVYYTHINPIPYTLKHIVVSLFLFILLLFASYFLFNHDPSLNPNLEKLLSTKTRNVSARINVFYPMLTVWMPNIPERTIYGKNWLTGYNRMLAYFRKSNTPVKPDNYADHRKLRLGGMSKTDQASINQLYIKRLQSNDPELNRKIGIYAKKYQSALQATRSFYNYKQYKNPIYNSSISYTGFYHDYSGSFLSLLRLNLLEALVDHSDDISTMTTNIRNKYYFDLKMIRYSHDPSVKLLYIQEQAVISQFLYRLLNKPEFQVQKFYRLVDNIPLMAKAVINQKRIARYDLQLIKHRLSEANDKLSHAHSVSTNLIRYAYKYHKTLNCIYARATRKYNLDNQEITAHINMRNVALTKASLNNVIGNAICKASIADSKDDIFIKSVETNGKLMILKARGKLLENKITIFNIGAFLTNHSNQYFNPFSGRPLKWDRTTKQIYFVYNNGNKNVRVSY